MDDGEVRGIFEFLAGEEQDHEKWLRGIARDLMSNAAPETQTLPGPDTVSPGIFTRENIKNAGGIIVSALHIGIMMEKASKKRPMTLPGRNGGPNRGFLRHRVKGPPCIT